MLKAEERLKAKGRKPKAARVKLVDDNNQSVHLHKAFCFRFSAFSILKAFSFLLSALSFSSCSFNPALQGKGETYLQGQWQQDSGAVQRKMLTYSLHNIRFNCDSFYLTVSTFTKVNYGADSCMRTGKWKEYVKGVYQQKNDTLHLNGDFCNERFVIRQKPGCFRNGPYREEFKVNKQGDTLVTLTGPSVEIPVQLRLVKRTTCTQKPI